MSYCKKCGAKIEEGTNFCGNCGAIVGSATKEKTGKKKAVIGIAIGVAAAVAATVGVCFAMGVMHLPGAGNGAIQTVNSGKENSAVSQTEEPQPSATEQPQQTEASQQAETEQAGQTTDNEAAYQNTLAELKKKYGTFSAEQTGTMKSEKDAWQKTTGVMGSAIADFDSDGDSEMLVCVAEKDKDHWGVKSENMYEYWNHLKLYMYESKDGEIVQAAETALGPYNGWDEEKPGPMDNILPYFQAADRALSVSVVTVQGKSYLVCDDCTDIFVDSSGGYTDYSFWIMEYAGGAFQYVYSLTGGIDGYNGWTFRKGKCVGTDDWTLPGIDLSEKDFLGEKLSKLFSNYGILLSDSLKNAKHPGESYMFLPKLSPKNDRQGVFRFTCRVIEKNPKRYTFPGPFKLKAVLSDGNHDSLHEGPWLFEDSDCRYLTENEVKKLSKETLRLARNELYARHGYIFSDKELEQYFKKKPWYSDYMSQEEFNESEQFNKYEIANRDLLLKYERKK